MKMNLFFTILIALTTSTTAASANEVEIVKDIIGLHQQDARRILGSEIALYILETNDEPNASASYTGPNNGPLLTYYSSLLHLQRDDDVVTVVCHELGHFLGSRAPGKTRIGNAIESEADYFAGKCSVRYYTSVRGMSLGAAQEATANGAKLSFERLYQQRINPNQARSQQYMGINPSYSEPDCRVLTVIHGAMGWKRPTCWYNPQ